MASFTSIGSAKPVGLIGTEEVARVTNTNATGTLYVGGSSVTSDSNAFSIAAGAQRIVSGPVHAIGSTDVKVLIEPIGVGPRTGVPNTRFYTVGPVEVNTGTSSTPTANTAQVGEVNITNRCKLTGIRYLIGATGGTDKAIGVLYDGTGKVVANSAKAGTTVGTADTYQSLAFETATEILSPGRYFIGVIYNGTTARIETAGDRGILAGTAASAADFSAAPVGITVPSSVAAGSPIANTY